MKPPAVSGFNHQASERAPPAARGAFLGMLLGGLLAWTWLETEREDLLALQQQQQSLKAELGPLEAQLMRAKDQSRLAQLRRDEWALQQSWQAARLNLLDSLEALASVQGARLRQLQFEGRVLSVQGLANGTTLRSWVDAVDARLPAWAPGQLLELYAEPASVAEPGRFALRWTAPATQDSP